MCNSYYYGPNSVFSPFQAFVATGTNIQLVFHAGTNGYTHGEHGRDCDFEKEHGKVRSFLVRIVKFLNFTNGAISCCLKQNRMLSPIRYRADMFC